MELGYNPARISALSRRTLASIDSLSALRSSDQAAADALQAIRLTRQNLEDHWMPLIREIESSDAMVGWLSTALDAIRASGSRLAEWFTHKDSDTAEWTEYSERSNEELLEWLAYASNIAFPWDEHFGHAVSALTAFSEDLAERVKSSTDFAASLVRLAPSAPLIAFATGEAEFPASFTGAVITSMLGSMSWISGLDAHRESAAVQVAMTTLLDDPGAVLDALADADVLFSLAKWPLLETTLVQQFTTAGLYEAILIDNERLGDGYEVIAQLTRLTNGPLDGRMQPGLARGVAIAMNGYINTFAPAIGHKGSHPVFVIDRKQNVKINIGTYDELVDLFGAIMSDAPAQAALGAVLGGYTRDVISGLGTNINVYLGLENVAQFADLLGDAIRAEQAELVMSAAADEAVRRQVAGAVRFGVDVGLSATGIGAIARGLTSRAMDSAVDWAANVAPDEMVDLSIPSYINDLITIAAVAMVFEHPSMRASLGLQGISDESWKEVDEQLDDIDKSGNFAERIGNIATLNDYIEKEVPELGGYVRAVRDIEGICEIS